MKPTPKLPFLRWLALWLGVAITSLAGAATARISGHVQDNAGNPVVGVVLSGGAFINGENYSPAMVTTDDSGNYSLAVTATLSMQWEHAGIILTNGDATDPATTRLHPASIARLPDQLGLYYSTWTNKTLTGPVNEGRIKLAVATNLSQFNSGKLGVIVSPSTLTSGSYTYISGPQVRVIDGVWWMCAFAGTNNPPTFEGESSAGVLLYSTNGINWTEAPSSPYAPLPPRTGTSWDVRNVFVGTLTKVDELWYIHYIAYQSAPWPAGGDNGYGYLHFATSTNPMVAGSWVRAVGQACVFDAAGAVVGNVGGNGSIVWLPDQQKWLAQLGPMMATCTNRHPTNFVVQTSWLNTGLTNGAGWDQLWGFSFFDDDGLAGVWDSHPGVAGNPGLGAITGGDFIRVLRPVSASGQWSVSFSASGNNPENLANHGLVDLFGPYQVNISPTNAVLNITVHPAGTSILSAPERLSASQVRLNVNGAINTSYTLQVSTNLAFSNWASVFSFQLTASPFQVVDSQATNSQRYYRLLKN